MTALPAPTRAPGRDQRSAPRFRTHLPATMSNLPVAARNLSRCGSQIACHAMVFEFLQPKLRTEPIQLCLELPRATLVLESRLAYVNEYGSEFLIGLGFTPDNGHNPAQSEALGEISQYIESLIARGAWPE